MLLWTVVGIRHDLHIVDMVFFFYSHTPRPSKWHILKAELLDAMKTFNSSAVAVPSAFSLLLKALEDFVGQELLCCGSVRDVQRGRRGLERLGQTVEQPLSEGQSAGRGTSSSIRTEDGVKERAEDEYCDCNLYLPMYSFQQL